MHEWVSQTWHLKKWNFPKSLGTSWDAKNIFKKIFYLVNQSSFLMFPITKIFFSSLQFKKVKIEGVSKCLWFFFTFVTINQQTAGLEKKDYSLEQPAYQDKRVDGPNISVSWTGTKLGP